MSFYLTDTATHARKLIQHARTHTHTHARTHAHTHMHARMHTHAVKINACIMQKCTLTVKVNDCSIPAKAVTIIIRLMHTHTHTHARTHARTRARAHKYTHARTHAYTHTVKINACIMQNCTLSVKVNDCSIPAKAMMIISCRTVPFCED